MVGSGLALGCLWVGSALLQLERGWTASLFSPSVGTVTLMITGKGRLDPFSKECESIDCAIIGPAMHIDVAATDEGSVVGA